MSNKVKCESCLNEVNGFCQEKTNAGKPVKISLGKPRICDIFVSDPLKNTEKYSRSIMAAVRASRVQEVRKQLVKLGLTAEESKEIEK